MSALRASYRAWVRRQLERGAAMCHFARRPDDDPAGAGWTDFPGLRALRGIRTSAMPPGLSHFDGSADTNPGIRTIVGPLLPRREPAIAAARIEGAITRLGSELEPPLAWELRVLAAVAGKGRVR